MEVEARGRENMECCEGQSKEVSWGLKVGLRWGASSASGRRRHSHACSLPLDRPRRLAGHIIHDTVHAAYCGRQKRGGRSKGWRCCTAWRRAAGDRLPTKQQTVPPEQQACPHPSLPPRAGLACVADLGGDVAQEVGLEGVPAGGQAEGQGDEEWMEQGAAAGPSTPAAPAAGSAGAGQTLHCGGCTGASLPGAPPGQPLQAALTSLQSCRRCW